MDHVAAPSAYQCSKAKVDEVVVEEVEVEVVEVKVVVEEEAEGATQLKTW